jgi:hypothetical protein
LRIFCAWLVFPLADRLDGAGDRGDALDGTVVLQLFGNLGAAFEIAVHQRGDHQALLDVDIVGLEFERRAVELGGGIEIVIDIGSAGSEKRARKAVDRIQIEWLAFFDRRLFLGKARGYAGKRRQGQEGSTAEQAKKVFLPHDKPFVTGDAPWRQRRIRAESILNQ